MENYVSWLFISYMRGWQNLCFLLNPIANFTHGAKPIPRRHRKKASLQRHTAPKRHTPSGVTDPSPTASLTPGHTYNKSNIVCGDSAQLQSGREEGNRPLQTALLTAPPVPPPEALCSCTPVYICMVCPFICVSFHSALFYVESCRYS